MAKPSFLHASDLSSDDEEAKETCTISTIYVYDCNECDLKGIETSFHLDLLKDNCTNWTICKKCRKDVQYTRKQKIEYINTK